VRAPFHRVRVSAEKQEHRFIVEERAGLAPEEWRVLLNLVALSAQGLVESVLGRPMKEARFELPYPAPEYVARYGEYFHAPVRFGCRETAMVIPSVWLARECPLADPVMYEASLRSLQTGDRRLEGRSFTVARVEQVMASRGERLGMEKAARLLHVSRRTLVRRLQHGGTTYRSLLEAQQKKRAEVLLRDSELSVAEVAYELGYEDPANFGRACRRWFGVSPGKWRARAAR
jgi:AraC-like DNA-binding protein